MRNKQDLLERDILALCAKHHIIAGELKIGLKWTRNGTIVRTVHLEGNFEWLPQALEKKPLEEQRVSE